MGVSAGISQISGVQGWTTSLISFFPWWNKENRVLIFPILKRQAEKASKVANKSKILANLVSGDIPEPEISTNDFLDSLQTFGVWMRVLSAAPSLEQLMSKEASPAEQWAALSNIYLQLGAQAEDHATLLVAFNFWSKHRDLSLPKIVSSIFVKRPSQTTGKKNALQDTEKQLLKGKKLVQVDLPQYFLEVAAHEPKELVSLFLGYQWRKKPSVNLVPEQATEFWAHLPNELHRVCSELTSPVSESASSVFNKIKHGPQLVIQGPHDRAKLRWRELPNKNLPTTDLMSRNTVRVMLGGERTQERPKEYESGKRVAPFLIHDPQVIDKLFYETLVHEANIFFAMVTLQKSIFTKGVSNFRIEDAGIRRIVEKGSRRIGGL